MLEDTSWCLLFDNSEQRGPSFCPELQAFTSHAKRPYVVAKPPAPPPLPAKPHSFEAQFYVCNFDLKVPG